MDLYTLNKDMLVKLITTIQDDSKPKNLGDVDLQKTIIEYTHEMFERKTKIIKEYLNLRYVKWREIIEDISIFKLVKDVIVFGVKTKRMIVQITNTLSLNISLFNAKGILFYSFKENIDNIIPEVEHRSPDIDYETYKEYVDFVKFLKEVNFIDRIMKYLDIYSTEKLEND
jgi:hypothetical protein